MTLLADLLICLRFFSRLPVPTTQRERALGASGLVAAAAMAPVAGLALALFPCCILAAAAALRLPPLIAATLALATQAMVTGALHEDALADCADGFGGGRTRERKLAIMRDSAVGAFGAVAIAFSLLLRCFAIESAIMAGHGGIAITVAAVLSRAACFVPLAMLSPARSEGVGAVAMASWRALGASGLVAIIVTIVLAAWQGVSAARTADAVLVAMLAALAVSALAWRQIGGQTGDVAGAAQQGGEIAVLIVFAAGAT